MSAGVGQSAIGLGTGARATSSPQRGAAELAACAVLRTADAGAGESEIPRDRPSPLHPMACVGQEIVVTGELESGKVIDSPRSREVSTKVGVDGALRDEFKGGFTTPKHIHGG